MISVNFCRVCSCNFLLRAAMTVAFRAASTSRRHIRAVQSLPQEHTSPNTPRIHCIEQIDVHLASSEGPCDVGEVHGASSSDDDSPPSKPPPSSLSLQRPSSSSQNCPITVEITESPSSRIPRACVASVSDAGLPSP